VSDDGLTGGLRRRGDAAAEAARVVRKVPALTAPITCLRDERPTDAEMVAELVDAGLLTVEYDREGTEP
jgi:hypothetical protein